MTAPVRSTSAKAYGRITWVFVPTIAAFPTTITSTECTGAATQQMTGYVFTSSGTVEQNTNRVTKPKRVIDTVLYEQLGDTAITGGEIRYAFDPQSAAASVPKKLYEKLVPGSTGYFVRRLGVDGTTDLAVGQFVDAFPVEVGPQLSTIEGDDEAGEIAIVQTFAVTGPPALVKALT